MRQHLPLEVGAWAAGGKRTSTSAALMLIYNTTVSRMVRHAGVLQPLGLFPSHMPPCHIQSLPNPDQV